MCVWCMFCYCEGTGGICVIVVHIFCEGIDEMVMECMVCELSWDEF